MNRFVTLASIGFLGFTAACGTEVGVGSTSGTGGQAGGSSTSTASAGGATSATTTTGDPSTTSATSTTGGTGGGGTFCGGLAGIPCAADEYCSYHDLSCGGNDGGGTCLKRPMACDKNLIPTCACDGKIYGNPCEANAAGYDVSVIGNCQAPAGQFGCGPNFCTKATSYCVLQISDVATEPNTYTCSPLPGSCGASPSCACLSADPCQCAMTSDGGLKLSCPGG